MNYLAKKYGCIECFFADQKAIKEEKSCCIFPERLNCDEKKCYTKKVIGSNDEI